MKKGKKWVYVAGPMAGEPKLNRPKFRRVAAALRRRGWQVVSPVEIGETMGLRGESAEEVDQVLLKSVVDAELRALRACDAIWLMDGWERSAGTLREVVVAISFGLELLLESGGAAKAAKKGGRGMR